MEEIRESVRNLFKNKFNVKYILICKRESKTGAQKSRLMVITDYRIFFLSRSPLSVEKFFHLVDIKSLECLSQEKLVISSWTKTVIVISESGFVRTAKEILSCLKQVHCSVPAQFLIQKFVMPSPQITSDVLNEVDQMSFDKLPCGNFSAAYRCMCDFYNYPCLEDVVWDVEAIYFLHDTKEFNFRDFDHLDARNHLPIMSALQHNSYFTRLNLSNIKMNQSNVAELSKILKHNTTLKQLNLSNTSLKVAYLEKLCEAIQQNSNTSISYFDLSKNNLDDKSISCVSSLNLKWEGFNLSDTSLPQNGIVSLFTSLTESGTNFVLLTYLDLSRNVIKKEGTAALSNFLSNSNSVEKLILENCEIPLANFIGHLHKGCTKHLQELIMPGNLLSKKKLKDAALLDLKEFFSFAESLKTLDLSYCHLTHEALKPILLGLAVNSFLSDFELKLTGNGFDSKTLDVFEVCLPLLTRVTSLDISNNSFSTDDFKVLFDKLSHTKNLKKLHVGKNLQNTKNKNLGEAVEAIVSYLKIDDLVLECLHIDEMNLKSEAFLFLNHLGGDTHLTELNISTNYMGPAGACLLSKALQINCTLRKIILDRNDFNVPALIDIAYALSRNYFLKNLPLPFHDIINQQRLAPERSERLEEVIKKIEFYIARNNSPSLLLADKTFASKLHSTQIPLLNNLQKASQNLQSLINNIQESSTILTQSSIREGEILLEESQSFIKMYRDYHLYLRQQRICKEQKVDDNVLLSLLRKFNFSGTAYQTESMQSLLGYISNLCPSNYELMKKKVQFESLKIQEVILSPILSQIMEDTEQTLNISVPYVVSELLRTISDLLTSNLEEYSDSITRILNNNSDQTDESDTCRTRGNSVNLKNMRSNVKEEMKSYCDTLMDGSFMRTLKKNRPVSSFTDDLDNLYLPVTTDSLEHLALQRPKPLKKHKPTLVDDH